MTCLGFWHLEFGAWDFRACTGWDFLIGCYFRSIAGDRFPADLVHDRLVMNVRPDAIVAAVRIDDAENFALFPLVRQDLRDRREAVFRQAVEPGAGCSAGSAPLQPGTFGTRIGVTIAGVHADIEAPFLHVDERADAAGVPFVLHGRAGLAGRRRPAGCRAGASLRPGRSSWPGHRCAAYPAGPGRPKRPRAGSSRCPPRRTRSDTPARCRRICSRTR